MIKVEESSVLFSLLNAENQALDEIMTDFNSKFPRIRHFRLCTSLLMLLEVSSNQTLTLLISLYPFLFEF